MEENKENPSNGQEMNRLKMMLNKYKSNKSSNKVEKTLNKQNTQNIQEEKYSKKNGKPTFSISLASEFGQKTSRNSLKPPNSNSSGVNNLENFEIPSNNKHLLKILYDYNKQEKSLGKKLNIQGNYYNESNSLPTMSEPSTSSSRAQNNKNSGSLRSNENRNSFSNVLTYMKNSKNLNTKNTLCRNNNSPTQIQQNNYNPLFISNNENYFEYEDNPTGVSVLNCNLNQQNSIGHNSNDPSATSSLMSSVVPEHPKVVVHNCENIVKTIGQKITNLKLKLIQDDIKFRIDINKLLFNDNILKIVKFMGGDIYGLFKCNKIIHNMLKTYIRSQSEKIIKKFEDKYEKFFNISKNFVVIAMNKNKKLNVDLVIKASLIIPEEYYDYTFIISEKSKYIGDKKFLKNIYKFNYENNRDRSKVWIMREMTSFNADELDKAYIQPILPFSYRDFFEVSINLVSDRGILDFDSFEWLNLKSENNPCIDPIEYNPSRHKKEILEFDLSRICELEIIKNNWNDYSNITNSMEEEAAYRMVNLIQELRSNLMPCFRINKILFDEMGYLLLKIYLEAKEIGYITASKLLGINFIIKGIDQNVVNELKKNGLLFDRSNTFQLRKGDELVLYISKSKIN